MRHRRSGRSEAEEGEALDAEGRSPFTVNISSARLLLDPAAQGRHAMQNGSETAWLSLPQAAAALSCSVDTVRRRIKRGELPAKQVATQRGPAWRVLLSTPLSNVPTLGNDAGQPAGHEVNNAGVVALVELVGRLQEENRTLAGQVGFLQAQAQQAQETIRALQAGAEQAASVTPGGTVSPPPRPWWQFWKVS